MSLPALTKDVPAVQYLSHTFGYGILDKWLVLIEMSCQCKTHARF